LLGDLVGETIEVALRVSGEEYLPGHALRTFFLLRVTA
jgi:hypothetical protein